MHAEHTSPRPQEHEMPGACRRIQKLREPGAIRSWFGHFHRRDPVVPPQVWYDWTLLAPSPTYDWILRESKTPHCTQWFPSGGTVAARTAKQLVSLHVALNSRFLGLLGLAQKHLLVCGKSEVGCHMVPLLGLLCDFLHPTSFHPFHPSWFSR